MKITARTASIIAGSILLLGGLSHAERGDPPRLVLVIAVDQLRADYLERFGRWFLPAADGETVGGFRFLMDRGAWFVDAHHDHYPLYTGPGHAAIMTGAYPYKHGIVSNGWYDRTLQPPGPRNCVEDASYPEVGGDGKGRPVSPMTLRVTTVGDELKMATGGRSKVWGLAFKDRSAVLMAGHLADGALWGGWGVSGWVTSTYYARDGELPDWVARWNALRKPETYFGRKWELSLPREAFGDLWPAGVAPGPDVAGLGAEFPHVLQGGGDPHADRFYGAFGLTPFGNEFLVDTAMELVRQEHLGEDEIPDVLALGFSTNDGTGHVYGANSAEVADLTIQTDRQLSRLFNFLRQRIPGGLAGVTIVLTADHGASPTLGVARDRGLPAGFVDAARAGDEIEAALDGAFGSGDWIVSVNSTGLYLNLATVEAKGAEREKVERATAEAAMRIPGVYAAYTRHQILSGALPATALAGVVARSYHPLRGADVVWVMDSLHIAGEVETGATHGAPYAYDTSVPLLFEGRGIRPGRFAQRVSTIDIAPTLSAILSTLHPSGCEGRILAEALTGFGG